MPNTGYLALISLGLAVLPALTGCEGDRAPVTRRAEIRAVGPSLIEVVPSRGQLENCLIFTESESGVIRQLTMPFDDLSVPCEAGKPIGDEKYKIPVPEGKVRVYVIFSDRVLKGATVASQLHEAWSEKRIFTAMDLRAPGQAAVETLEFTPSK
jgi:hypothetical protein